MAKNFTVIKDLSILKVYAKDDWRGAYIIKWNEDEPVIDIRDWRRKKGELELNLDKGLTLTSREARKLAFDLLKWAEELDDITGK